MSFISELKRRNVIRVAVLYLVAAWLIVQVVDVGMSILGLPDWSGRLVVLLLVIGFPFALIFSWVYEITPEGLKREHEVDRARSITNQTAKKLDIAVIALLLLSLGSLVADRLLPGPVATRSEHPVSVSSPERSIAVLPFVNMSADAANEYFSDGISEELLNLLARIPELRVMARTSAFSFKGSDAGIEEIAAKLKVTHLLEGSVRKSGDRIRITAQLIDAADGYHLWSDTWDRTLTDVFVIQDEIAAAVVDALKVKLLGDLPRANVTDARAYSLYLQARSLGMRQTKESYEEAVNLYTQALAIDPEFADAWAELASAQTDQAGRGHVSPAAGYARANASAERALFLDPRNVRAMSALGWNAMYWDWDFDKAAKLIGEARRIDPRNASMLNAYAVLIGNFGRTDAANALYREALQSDPLAVYIHANLTGNYLYDGRFEEAALQLEAMRRIDPDMNPVSSYAGWLEMLQGNPTTALEHFAGLSGSDQIWHNSLAYNALGRIAEADAALQTLRRRGAHATQLAIAYAQRGDIATAFEWLDRAYEEHDDWLIEIRTFWFLKPLHRDARWHALLEKLGLTDADAARIGL